MLKLSKVKLQVRKDTNLKKVQSIIEPIGFHSAVTFYKEKSFKVGPFVLLIGGSLQCISRGRYYMKNKVAYLEEELPVYYK